MALKKRGLFSVVLLVFLLVLFSGSIISEDEDGAISVGGCYYYPEASEDYYCISDTLYSEASADCADYDGCEVDQYFSAGLDCSEMDICDAILCNADCSFSSTVGKCTQLGGEEINDEDYDLWCNPGCCIIEQAPFCGFVSKRFECQQTAINFLGSDSGWDFINPAGMTSSDCTQTHCGGEGATSGLNISVKDETGVVIQGVNVELVGYGKSDITSVDGTVSFSNLVAGSYNVEVSSEGYFTQTVTILVEEGETISHPFTLLEAEGQVELQGTITGEDGTLLANAKVSIAGVMSDFTFTNDTGGYTLTDLPFGNYTIKASKSGYQSAEQNVTLAAEIFIVDFTLSETAFVGISGQTFVDFEGGGTGEAVYGVKIYIDGMFKGVSKPTPEPGNYEFEITVDEEADESETHTISAIYMDYEFAEEEFTISAGQSTIMALLLTRYVGECSEVGDEKPVEEFSVSHVLGKAELNLKWRKPCLEVVGYLVTKTDNEGDNYSFSISSDQINHLDDEVEWGKSYTYEIITNYDDSSSEIVTYGPITVGDEECEDKYHAETGWESFCIAENSETEQFERKSTWTCNNENTLVPIKNCAEMDGEGESYYCSVINSLEAGCKDTGGCKQFGTPFGLYYSADLCYGGNDVQTSADAENYCYFENTDTVAQECKSCHEVESCFDYQSQDACLIDNCLGDTCNWVNGSANNLMLDYGMILPELVTPETGHGYCVEKDYKKDDKCSLCGPDIPPSSLFENYYCTPEVCSGLGGCFSVFTLSACESCGTHPTKEVNCYAYSTALECAGEFGNSIYKSPATGEISLSEDRCEWGRCLWNGNPGSNVGSCVKDGNADKIDDCSLFTSAGDVTACRKDVSAPESKVLPEGVNILSYGHPNVTFYGDDHYHQYSNQRNVMGQVGYCLTPTDSDECIGTSGEDKFTYVDYEGKLQEEFLEVEMINSSYLDGKIIKGDTYKLKYFSLDKYYNQENMKQTFVFIDNVKPEFEHEIETEITGDIADVTIYLSGMEEMMSCEFSLEQTMPPGNTEHLSLSRDAEEKEVVFVGVGGVKHELNITCTDDRDNVQLVSDKIILNLDQDIQLIYPAMGGAISENEFVFKVSTSVGASCTLNKDDGEKVVDFNIIDEVGKIHETTMVSGFVQKEYNGEYQVICHDFYTEEEHVAFFDFVVDFMGPDTTLYLEEGARSEIIAPQKNNGLPNHGWEEYFVDSVNVTFECIEEGVACAESYYCLGDSCPAVAGTGYILFSEPLVVEETTQICYYSKDVSDNPTYPLCGTLFVEGYGIFLESPTLHYYQDEQWGVSNQPNFNFVFSTKVETSECKFDFVPGFNYDSLPDYKMKLPDADYKYVFTNFPESVYTEFSESGSSKAIYIKCKDLLGELGPEQKINLEFDPSAPKIENAYANPVNILDDVETELNVITDDKTLCKYSDNSEGQGSADYQIMEGTFPGYDGKIMNLTHQEIFAIALAPGIFKKDYSLNTMCSNGAGDISEIKELTFNVDFSALGGILSVSPEGYIPDTNVTLTVETNKNAVCLYKLEGVYTSMVGTGGKLHTAQLSGLVEKEYIYPIKCDLSGHKVESEIKFTVDTTSPTITGVDDGGYSCGTNKIKVMVYTDEESIGGYEYEIYDLGEVEQLAAVKNSSETEAEGEEEESSSTADYTSNYYDWGYGSSTDETESSPSVSTPIVSVEDAVTTGVETLVSTGTLGPETPLEVPLTDLSDTHKYLVKVRAGDSAGNWGEFVASDGFLIVDDDFAECEIDENLGVIFTKNNSCTHINVVMKAQTKLGVGEFNYGVHADSGSCGTNTSYGGTSLIFDKAGWVCYYLEDTFGTNKTGKEMINFIDQDNDGFMDSCDDCPDTPAGKIAGPDGCADGQVSVAESQKDTDGDSLPDIWEKINSQEGCLLNYMAIDSDDNGVTDDLEDFDGDGYNNYEEYISGYNPCLADAPIKGNESLEPTDEPGGPDTTDTPYEPTGDGSATILAWILFLLGFFMMLGGSGYLVYYYMYTPEGKKSALGVTVRPVGVSGVKRPTSVVGQKPVVKKPSVSWKERINQLRTSHTDKLKTHKRKSLFGTFGKDSTEIPHLKKVLRMDRPHQEKVKVMADHYTEHKEEIKPGLKHGEKSLFNRLEQISKQTKEKKVGTVVSKTEAKDIFAKLKGISNKRKEN